jgi:hypothetical protein
MRISNPLEKFAQYLSPNSEYPLARRDIILSQRRLAVYARLSGRGPKFFTRVIHSGAP